MSFNFDWNTLLSWRTLIQLIDLGVVWYLIYKILFIIRGTRAINLVKGIIVLLAIKALSYFIGLHTLDFLINMVIQWGIIGLIVVFQPEIRRGLDHIGRSSIFVGKSKRERPSERLINELIEATYYMAKRRIGALISIEVDSPLEEYIDTGIRLDATVSSQLLINTFIPNTPLHDGAVIIKDYRIATAASYLPLSESSLIPKELGTRHRAAIGLSEVTDAVTIVASEETGSVSITHNGRIFRDLDESECKRMLEGFLSSDDKETDSWNIWDLLDNYRLGGKNDE
ncbi:TIGR00159 family protein [Atopobacter sp. AH10]|uniref:diadenylate cyclase CdaA n=1 Tax=Atopobacter sp. AH10 TaxID=2315861 RepID=UPI000EF241E5|nr:TIGR00159 family protein [Atopobacter sp. AH10]